MADVLEREKRVWILRRPSLAAIVACVLAFGASSNLSQHTVSHWLSTALGIAMVLFAIAPALREISDSAVRWTTVAGSLVIGAGLGLFIQLIFR